MATHRLSVAPDITEIPRLLDWVETCCGDAGVGGDIPFKLALSLDEAVVNVINHAFDDLPPPHRIEVELVIEPDRVTALVVDNGRAFDPSAAPAPDTDIPLADRFLGGLGIHLIRRMMDRVDYRRADGENRLRLEKAR
jgi:anti-sigma regulatory factor (Ser/Thr protein kinase)